MAKGVGGTLHLFHAYDISGVHSGKAVKQDEIEDNMSKAREKIRKLYVPRIKDFDEKSNIFSSIEELEIGLKHLLKQI